MLAYGLVIIGRRLAILLLDTRGKVRENLGMTTTRTLLLTTATILLANKARKVKNPFAVSPEMHEAIQAALLQSELIWSTS